MNLRCAWGGFDIVKPVSDALEYITTRINLIWLRQHTADGLHVFTGTDVPFSVLNFGSATAGQTWTLVAADQVTYRYVTIGGWVFVLGTFGGTVGGAAGNALTIRLPFTVPLSVPVVSGAAWVFDGGAGQAGLVTLDQSVTVGALRIAKATLANWTNGAIFVRFMVFWEMR